MSGVQAAHMEVPDAVPREALLRDLPPTRRFQVLCLHAEERDDLLFESYQLSSYGVDGTPVTISFRLCLVDPGSRSVVFSVPGGAGRFPDETLWWLAKVTRQNHCCVDWLGRGQSPPHPRVRCLYDPFYAEGDDVADMYMFHNLRAIWSVVEWLFSVGFEPRTVAGGSWGGVLSFLLASIDDRIEQIFPTFGCGGFFLPELDLRNYWFKARAHMGPRRTAAWCGAFDPLLRIADVAARVHFDTASNDKFFSLSMAMRTWAGVRNRGYLSIVPNQDHTMQPFSTQPYMLASGIAPVTEALETFSRGDVRLDEGGPVVRDGPPGTGTLRLLVSTQQPERGLMSRDWRVMPQARIAGADHHFPWPRAEPGCITMCFATRSYEHGGKAYSASTIVSTLPEAGPPEAAPPPSPLPNGELLTCETGMLWRAPVGDRMNPRVTEEPDGWRIAFSAARFERFSRYGIVPWHVPQGWSVLQVELSSSSEAPTGLSLMLSTRYHLHDEVAVAMPFAAASSEHLGDGIVFHFPREGFGPCDPFPERFGPNSMGVPEAIKAQFDAVSLILLGEAAAVRITLRSIAIA